MKKLATNQGPVATGTPKGTKATHPGRGNPNKQVQPSKRSYALVAREATDVVIFCITSPTGYTQEQSAIIGERLNNAVLAAQSAGVPLKLANPGGLRRMFKITPEDRLTRDWLKNYVESGKLENAWDGARFTVREVADLSRRFKASLLIPDVSSQEPVQILALVKRTNPFLNTEGWDVHKYDHIKGPVTGNLIHVSLPEEDKKALEERNRTLYIGLHKVVVRFPDGKRKTAPPPKGPAYKKRK